MTTSSAEHWLTLKMEHDYNLGVQVPVVYGISSWDMPDGNRLRREMRRAAPCSGLVRLAKIRRGGRCRIPGDSNPERVWTRMTGGFVYWWCHQATKHTYQCGMETMVQPVDD